MRRRGRGECHRVMGASERKISRPEKPALRPRAARPNLDRAYCDMAAEKAREAEAFAWAETTYLDVRHETRPGSSPCKGK